MTTNPWERLRKAALRLTRSVNKLVHPLHDNALRRDAMESVDAVQAALAALPPAQTDAEREQAIEAWRAKAESANLDLQDSDGSCFPDPLLDEAVALMRSAPQKPAAEDSTAFTALAALPPAQTDADPPQRYSDDRRSLAQEIAETLRHNGHWVPKEWCGPDLITAVGMALQRREETDQGDHEMNTNNELLQAAKEVMRLSEREKAIEELASRVTRRVAEMPDRSSPEDWPEAMLVTSDELVAIIEDEAVALMRSAPLPAPAVPSEAEIEAWRRRLCNLAVLDVNGDVASELGELCDEAVALMRRAAGGAS